MFVYEGSGYGGATPVDPAAPEAHETTPFNQRGTLFAETPWHIIDKIGEKRGKLGSSAILSREIKEKPIYEKYVFLEQIEALAAQSSWIPYAHDLNIILKKTNTQPLNFFLHQYRAHTGEDMPMNLQQRIIQRLSTEKIENMKNPLFRKGLLNKVNNEKDQAMILDREDEKLIANSWMPQEGTLVASTDLKGVLPEKKVEKEITLSTDENNIKRAETNFPIIYEAAKKVGIKFPEIPASQFGEESAWGKKPSGENNYWGIKATPQEVKDGKATLVTTSEVINGKEVIIKDYFKNFDTIEDALKQYKEEWNDDFQGRTGSSKGKTRKEAIQILKDGGYATNPNYVDTIETIANEYSDLY